MPEPFRSGHACSIRAYLETGKRNNTGIGRNIKGLHKNGSAIDINQSAGEIKF